MSETQNEQEEILNRISVMTELPEINKEIFRSYAAIQLIKEQFLNIFSEIDLYEERITRLKERAAMAFEKEQVKSYPDPEFCGTLTLVSGRRYIPIRKAQEMLEPRVYAALVETGKEYVKWTPPKQGNENE